MPIFEGVCLNKECHLVRLPQEHYYKNGDDPMMPCDSCGGPTERILSDFGIVFTGPITARYNDRDLYGAHQDGHWAYERDPVTNKPRPVHIETWDDQREFCKRNNLINPKDMGRNYTVAEDGRTVTNSRGLPGTEI